MIAENEEFALICEAERKGVFFDLQPLSQHEKNLIEKDRVTDMWYKFFADARRSRVDKQL